MGDSSYVLGAIADFTTLPGDIWDVVSPEGEVLREVLVAMPDSAYFFDMDVCPHGIIAFDMFTEEYHRLYILE